MLFIHCQQEEGHHDQHHTHGSHAVSRRLTEPQEQRYTYKRPGGKADQLPSCQIEHDLGFDFGEIFGYGYISHIIHLLYGNEIELSTSFPHTSQPGVD